MRKVTMGIALIVLFLAGCASVPDDAPSRNTVVQPLIFLHDCMPDPRFDSPIRCI